MPALPSSVIEPLWDQFATLIPVREVTHPWGCHRPRIPDRVVFDKLVQVLVFGVAYAKIADSTCSATTIRDRRDEWITLGVFTELEQLCLEAYDSIVGLELDHVTVDGCITKAPCGGEAAGKSPVDRGANRAPNGCCSATAPASRWAAWSRRANRHDSVFLRPTLERVGRFETRFGIGLPTDITVHLDAGFDSVKTRDLLDELGCEGLISVKGFPLQAGRRWVIERTNSWHNRGFGKLAICTERHTRVIDAFVALAKRRHRPAPGLREAWTTHRWDTRPARRP